MLLKQVYDMPKQVAKYMENLEPNNALGSILKVVRFANKYIEDTAPWTLKENKERLGDVLHNLYFVLHSVAVLLEAFIPQTAQKILDALKNSDKGFETISQQYNTSICGFKVEKTALYQRLDVAKEVKYLEVDSVKASANNSKEEKKMEEVKQNENKHVYDVYF